MKRLQRFVLGGLLGAGALQTGHTLVASPAANGNGKRATVDQSNGLLHTERTFYFNARAPIALAGPLFGADKEKVWAPDWNPEFAWPEPPNDREGMVFSVVRGARTAIWINTCLDLKNGRVQYAYFIPNTLVTLIDIKLTPNGDTTLVEVTYERTALDARQNAQVREMAELDGQAGPEWERQINNYLETAAGK